MLKTSCKVACTNDVVGSQAGRLANFWRKGGRLRGFGTELEGNVLRNLRPAMFQMLMGKILLSSVKFDHVAKSPFSLLILFAHFCTAATL